MPDESKKIQEATRQFYEKQLQEREDRIGSRRSNNSQKGGSSLPPAKTRDESAAVEKQALLDSRRKIIDEMERLEREKERVKQELVYKDVLASSRSIADPAPGFLQDVNRERFKQVPFLFWGRHKKSS